MDARDFMDMFSAAYEEYFNTRDRDSQEYKDFMKWMLEEYSLTWTWTKIKTYPYINPIFGDKQKKILFYMKYS